ncbi:MAG: TonB C-terminal domain-containing protein [Acidobacteriia bacterium]|nr:TonB C-terminal domain-containing protein [Terriglobia bacterium]
MFEYAIGHYQKHPPSRRLLASWVASILGHALAVLILYLNPQLLQGGSYLWFRQPVLTPPEAQSKQWRNLTFVAKMEMPSAEELKKYIYDWNRAKAEKEASLPPIRINLPPTNTNDFPPRLPKPRLDNPPIPGNLPIPVTAIPAVSAPPATSGDAGGDTKKAPPTGVTDVAPKTIPKGVGDAPAQPPGSMTTSGSTTASQAAAQGAGGKAVKDPGQEIRGGGDYLFDTKGFNFDEYGKLVKALIEQKWQIPSNLRDSQGSTTIVFYITKNGQVILAGIEGKGSGNLSLDYAALSAVWLANPLPPLPKNFPADRVGARFIFAYNERK